MEDPQTKADSSNRRTDESLHQFVEVAFDSELLAGSTYGLQSSCCQSVKVDAPIRQESVLVKNLRRYLRR